MSFCTTAKLRGDDLGGVADMVKTTRKSSKPVALGDRPEPHVFASIVLETIRDFCEGTIQGGPTKGAIIAPLRDLIQGSTRKRVNGALFSLTRAGWLTYHEDYSGSDVVWRTYELA